MAGLFGLAACSPARLASWLTPSEGVRREQGLAYGPLPRQRLDLYTPEGLSSDAPLVLFLPGGAWVSGQRAEYGFVGITLARLGAVAAVADYRLWPEAAYPSFVEDAALALRFLAPQDRPLVVMGHSAGAFNAAAVALDPRWGVRSLVSGLIGISGPYEFGAHEVTPPAIFAGLERIQAAPAPLTGAAPMLLLHGGRDTTVGPYHSEILAERARAAGVPVRHVVWPRLSHIDIMAGFAPASRWLRLGEPEVVAELGRFLTSVRGHPPAG
ncbi:alpha/beta hydrolase [Roseococcus microcysteis]|uniref:alpha/beta hydrolase n=1 Tax=Roseococcus microcysteis TaxID=2771361 RepID=UPI00168A95F9|nr:alpha/beta hydrolase [Roseococcus microcysteis]